MREIKPGVYFAGAINWDTKLFDELIPLPDGTSYNSYLVKGSEKTALIDTVDPSKTSELIDHLVTLGVDKLDYVIANHAEQDHSGSINDILVLYPEAKVVANAKCKTILMELLCTEEDKFITIEDDEELSLGDKTLRFIFTPWTHWPETMGTYIVEDKIYCSCDFFGTHFAGSNLYSTEEIYPSAKRYFAEIMMPFRNSIKKNIEKVEQLDAEIIAPSHGPLHDNPKFIIDAYKEWTSDNVKNQVLVPFVSMHGSVLRMVDYFCEALIEKGVTVKRFNLTNCDIGELAMELVDSATLVMGCSQVLAGVHPTAMHAAYLVNALRPKTKFVSLIGSVGWGGKMVEHVTGTLTNFKAEIIEPVISKGYPKDETFEKLDELAETIAQKHNEVCV